MSIKILDAAFASLLLMREQVPKAVVQQVTAGVSLKMLVVLNPVRFNTQVIAMNGKKR